MKYWKCLVCGYIHEGSEPPDKCPVCGAPKEKFVLLPEAVGKADYDAYAAKMGPRLTQILAKAKAEAEVAGMLAEAKQKAEDKARSEAELIKSAAAAGAAAGAASIPAPLAETAPAAATTSAPVPPAPDAPPQAAAGPAGPASPAGPAGPGPLFRLLARHHSHPMAVHVPNGIIPMVVFFIFLSSGLTFLLHASARADQFAVIGEAAAGLRQAAFLSLIYVLLNMPVVLFTGYVDWQVNLGGARTRVIITKIICGVCVTIIAALLIFWRFFTAGDTARNVARIEPGNLQLHGTYLLLHLLMLAFAAYAGYLGGKLAFKE